MDLVYSIVGVALYVFVAIMRARILGKFNKPEWYGVIPGLAEYQLGLASGLSKKYCIVMIVMLAVVIVTPVTGITLLTIGWLLYIAALFGFIAMYFVMCNQLVHVFKMKSWWTVLVAFLPFVGLVPMAFKRGTNA